MIDSVRGEVLHVGLDHTVIDVGGLGYRVHATPATLGTLRRGEQAVLTTTLVVREDAMTLYGFDGPPSRELFGLVQTVSGVGPRLAMAILAVLEPDALSAALGAEDVKTLTRVPGIGKRTAERMIVELRDKVAAVSGPPAAAMPGAPEPVLSGVREQVVDGLVGLGFPVAGAEQATDAVLAESTGAPGAEDVAAVLRSALSKLGRAR
ncbi:Holliday junction branch migration protein RuvA [Tomitella fengzijianii]|uniref:Holliday junction branch migration complex subunit RuvA n=1 Tax=Tomitella fengzijianii TaxID=2597660 RepID=A0A516X3D2_9ACTN|nr:Holliday junction branch migration protein RuvA [Tomitella fengzijianii]QDQ97564.1 Holliday junction branch migration protein RuvA [Tomitella fengzijianii]